MTNKRYVPATEIAKEVRRRLKAKWPETKFSVRSQFSVRSKKYAGGASINVRWTDGPTQKQVDEVTDALQSVSHIDNTDFAHHKPVELDGEPVHSGANYIFGHREFSPELLQMVAEMELANRGLSPDAIRVVQENGQNYPRFEGDAADVYLHDIIPVPMKVGEAARIVAHGLSETEIRDLYEQHAARPWHMLMTKDGQVVRRERFAPHTASEINARLTARGDFHRWVREFEPTRGEIVGAVQTL